MSQPTETALKAIKPASLSTQANAILVTESGWRRGRFEARVEISQMFKGE